MEKSLNLIEKILSKATEQKITNLTQDAECEEYFGMNFSVGEFKIKFRKAKVTPKKNGLFVTLWKRNAEKQTEPFHTEDDFDFYIIVAEQVHYSGFFLFPKKVLGEKQILTHKGKEGKRGFRIYPNWTKPESKQAEKTQAWQLKYFIDLSDNKKEILEKIKLMIYGE